MLAFPAEVPLPSTIIGLPDYLRVKTSRTVELTILLSTATTSFSTIIFQDILNCSNKHQVIKY